MLFPGGLCGLLFWSPVQAQRSIAIGGGAVSGLLHFPDEADLPAPVVLMLADGPAPDLRAERYIEHLLWAGIAVLEPQADGPDLPRLLGWLQMVQGVNGERVGLLGRGAGARIPPGGNVPVVGSVLLYPGCGSPPPRPVRAPCC